MCVSECVSTALGAIAYMPQVQTHRKQVCIALRQRHMQGLDTRNMYTCCWLNVLIKEWYNYTNLMHKHNYRKYSSISDQSYPRIKTILRLSFNTCIKVLT